MNKEEFAKNQHSAYRILASSLQNNNVSSAYLFEGNDSKQLLDVAFLLAKSLLCENDLFACDNCEICRRIESLNYADIIFVDGSIATIKKGDISHIIKQFSQTGIEKYEKKIYILHLVENAMPEAMNAILKFLEEPQKDVYAILTTTNKASVLSTIISRCQCIKLKPLTINEIYNQCIENNINNEDAHLCSHIMRDTDSIVELVNSDYYQTIKTNTLEIIDAFLDNSDEGIFQMQKFLKDSKDIIKDHYDLILNIMLVFFNECIYETFDKDIYLAKLIKKAENVNKELMLQLILETKDKINMSLNINLLFDRMFYRMKEGVMNE